MFRLRDYQSEGVDSVITQFSQGVRSTLMEWATGCGKTVAAAEVIRRFLPQQSLFICNSVELVDQAADKIQRHTGIKCRIERAEHRIPIDELFTSTAPVVATVQSLNGAWGDARRMHKFKPKLVIFDEADMAVAETFERVDAYVGVECNVLGITATPLRHDKKALGRIFKEVAHRYPLEKAVADGYLINIAARSVKVHGLDYSKLKVVRGGDYNQAQLAQIMEHEETVQRMIQASLEMIFGVEPKGVLGLIEPTKWNNILRGIEPFPFEVDHDGKKVQVRVMAPQGRKSIMFCSSVVHAEMAYQIFNRVVHDLADWVCGETSDDKREQRIADFRSGKTRIMCNYGVFARGFDEPSVEMVILGRPTASDTVIKQQIGRVTRPLPGVIDDMTTKETRLSAIAQSAKPVARVFDFVGNVERADTKTVVDILGGDYSDDTKAKARERMLKKGCMVATALSLMEQESKREQQEKRRISDEAEIERKKGLVAATKYSSRDVDLFGKKAHKPKQWHANKMTGKPATFEQQKRLGSLGVYPLGWTYNQARMLIADAAQNWRSSRGWKLSPHNEWAKHKKHA